MGATPRTFSFAFDNVTCSANQDIMLVKASATNGLELRRISLSAGAITAAAELRLRLKRMPATVTVGSGGTAPTINNVNDLQPQAVLSSVRANDTTQATTGGTAQNLAYWQWNVLQDFMEVPPTPEERWGCKLSEALVLDFSTTPGASTVLSGFMVFEET